MSDITSVEHNDRQAAVLTFSLVSVAVVLLYLDTISSIVSTWQTDAYSHGFVIIPVSVFLVWRKRLVLAQIPISRSSRGVAAVAGLSVLWWISDSLGVQLVSQFSVVGMIPATVFAIFGWYFTREIGFALCFLIFAIPFGEFLIPYLIDFTASFSVDALKLFSIPVFQDGQYFHVPSGSYQVAEACAGLRFFIATLALSVLYAHHLSVEIRKAVLFVGFALCLSILMNGIRATTVVLLLHFTDLDIAAGPDHKFVGWILYGLMMGLLIWVGNGWRGSSREEIGSNRSRTSTTLGRDTEKGISAKPMGVLVVFAVLTGPLLNLLGDQLIHTNSELTAGLPIGVDGWIAGNSTDSTWGPDYVGYSQMSLGNYERDTDLVDVALIRYSSQRQGAEITNTTNSVVDLSEWSLGNIDQLRVEFEPSVSFLVNEVIAMREGESRLIWYWTDVNGTRASGAFETKLNEIRNILSGRPVISTAIILSTPIENIAADKRALFRQFLSKFDAALAKCIGPASNYERCSLDAPNAKEG